MCDILTRYFTVVAVLAALVPFAGIAGVESRVMWIFSVVAILLAGSTFAACRVAARR